MRSLASEHLVGTLALARIDRLPHCERRPEQLVAAVARACIMRLRVLWLASL